MRLILLSLLGFCLVGCSSFESFTLPPPVPPEHFTPAQDGRVPSDSELESDAIKVLFDVHLASVSDRPIQDNLKLEGALRQSLSFSIKKQGIDIESGSQNNAQVERIRKALDSLKGKTDQLFMGQSTVDYFIDVAIHESSYLSSYAGGGWWNPWQAESEGTCEYTLKGSVIVDLAPLPSLRGNKRLVVEDDGSFSFAAKQTCPGTNAPQVVNEFADVRREIVDNLISCSSQALEGFLIPRAFITAAYFSNDDGRSVFRISAGSRAGFTKGKEVAIEQSVPHIPGRYRKVATAVVADSAPRSAFIELDDHNIAGTINRYDRVALQDNTFIDVFDRLSCASKVVEH